MNKGEIIKRIFYENWTVLDKVLSENSLELTLGSIVANEAVAGSGGIITNTSARAITTSSVSQTA